MSNLDQTQSGNEYPTKGGLGKITELNSDTSLIEEENECFSEPTLKSISKLGDVLSRIDKRMKREGFYIKCGKIVKYENPQC